MKKLLRKKRVLFFQCDCGCEFETDEYVLRDAYERWPIRLFIAKPPVTRDHYSKCPMCGEDVKF